METVFTHYAVDLSVNEEIMFRKASETGGAPCGVKNWLILYVFPKRGTTEGSKQKHLLY